MGVRRKIVCFQGRHVTRRTPVLAGWTEGAVQQQRGNELFGDVTTLIR